MAIVVNPESELGKELARWNRPRNQFDADGRPGMNCVGYEPYPAMVYRARKLDTGKVVCAHTDPSTGEPYGGCMLKVHNDQDMERAVGQGWRLTPKAALEHFEAMEREIAQAAAEAQYAVARMSEKAQAELKAANDATSDHVTDIPTPPKRAKGTPVTV